MKTTMDISVDQVTEDAVLAADLKDPCGALMLPVGTVLSRTVLDRLKARGVHSVCVVVEEGFSDEQRETLRQQIEEHLSHRFRKVDDQPLMQGLKKILLSHRLKELQ